MKLTKRQELILQAIIDDYTLTGIPVSSRTLSKRADLGVSSATIRNEMADLEEEGYLEQPHTSAGRRPSDKAYRLYVDTLMQVSRLNENEISHLRKYFETRTGAIENVLEATVKALSDATHLTSMVLAPKAIGAKILRIQFVRVATTKAMMLVVYDTMQVKDCVINVSPELNNDYLDMLSKVISDKVGGKNIFTAVSEIRSLMEGELFAHKAFMEELLDAVEGTLNPDKTAKKAVVLGGTQNIFNHPEYHNIDKAREMLEILETKDTLYDLLNKATNMEFTITIGRENELSQFQNMSIVTATYKIGDERIGSFGVIGPTRMDYGRVISVMKFVGGSMNQLLGGTLKDDND